MRDFKDNGAKKLLLHGFPASRAGGISHRIIYYRLFVELLQELAKNRREGHSDHLKQRERLGARV